MTVNNVNALLTYTANQKIQTAAKTEEVVKEGFDKLMTKMSDQLGNLQTKVDTAQMPAPKETVQTKAAESTPAKDTSLKDDTTQVTDAREETGTDKTDAQVEQDAQKEVTQQTQGTETETVQETVEEKAGELMQEVADVLEIPLEKVEEVMEILGLTAVDLFDPANLKQLLLNLTDSVDEVSLVTNESLYGNLQDLFAAVEESLGALQEELGVNDEELDALLEQMTTKVQEEVPVQDVTETPEVSVEGMKDYAVSVQRDGETVQIKVTVDDASGAKSTSEQVTDAVETKIQAPVKQEKAASDMGHGQENTGAGQQTAGNAVLQELLQRPETVEAPVEQPVYQSAQTEQIMNQIVEYMKINVSEDTQKMEMQLHPASLGTVNVQIAAKDGAITAQFTAQNETVRAVLEAQMIQLKEQFEEQGIKVDAVEVTVANHAYGDQPFEGQENMDQDKGGAKKGTRRINLDLLDEGEDLAEMEDSERIAVEMMQANGNTVDYMA